MTLFHPESSSRWFHVPKGERVIHRRCLHLFPPGHQGSLPVRANSARRGGGAHAICFAFHVLLAAATLFAGYPWNALWVLLPGVAVHLYPMLLQRSILLRLQPLLDRSPAGTS
jgi:hypothetical protein